MAYPDWLWIPITLWAAFAQTLRNATQRGLTSRLGTLGATLVRFLYGLPFALLWLWAVLEFTGAPLPRPGPGFAGWVALGALSQIGATALLLRTMQERNFALGVAYSKTEVVQVALFAFVALGDRVSLAALFAGFMGAAASAGWFTAFAIEAAANVRTLGLVELIFSYVVSLKLFREKLSAMELGGMALIALGIVVITLGR